MRRAYAVIALTALPLLAACGGGGGAAATQAAAGSPPAVDGAAPTAVPAETAADAGAAASPAPAVPAGAGTITVTVGSRTVTGVITECATSGGSVTATNIADASGDTIVVMMGSGMPIISGTIDGLDFALGTDAQGTLDGQGGSFSGSDAGTGERITGSFACP